MAERRMLSKTISTSRKVNRLPLRAMLLYTWIIPHTDDFGRMEGDAETIRAIVVPMIGSSVEDVENDLNLMTERGLIERYKIGEETYLKILNFDSFQTFKTDRPRRSEYPDENGKITVGNHRFPDGNIVPPKRREEKVREGKVREEKVREGKGREKTNTPPIAKISYLTEIPDSDLKEFTSRFVATEKQIKSKAEDLKLYCERKAKVYKNYKSFLLNALKNDFKERDAKTDAEDKYKSI